MRQWLKDNPISNFSSTSAREEAFLEHVRKREVAYQSVIAKGEVTVVSQVPTDNQQVGSGNNTEVFDPNKLGKKKPVEGSEVAIPSNKIQDNGQPFKRLSDVLKQMTENLTGEQIQRQFDIDFPINEKSLFRPIKE